MNNPDNFPDDGFLPAEADRSSSDRNEQEPKQRAKRGGCLKGCVVTLAIVFLLFVVSSYACGQLLSSAINEDPDEVMALAQSIATFSVPEGFEPETSIQAPLLGDLAFFARAGSEDTELTEEFLGLGRIHLDMDQKEVFNALKSMRGQSQEDENAEVDIEACSLSEREAFCLDALARDDSQQFSYRWRAAFVPEHKGARIFFFAAEESRFKETEAELFFDSIALHPKNEQQ